MSRLADLHLHTVASDGTWTPAELAAILVSRGIGVFSVTDHDSLASLPEAGRAAQAHGLAFMTGVEFSTQLDGFKIHLLGYGFDPEDPGLHRLAHENEEREAENDRRAVAVLESRGEAVSLDAYDRFEMDPGRGGWKSLQYLVDQGLCRDWRECLRLFFVGPGGIGLPVYPDPDVFIRAIHAAGGRAVLAHPGSGILSADEPESGRPFLDRLLGLGLDGFECFHPENPPSVSRYLAALTDSLDLVRTGGSDCHGSFVPERQVGRPPVRVSDLRLKDIRLLANPG